MISVSLSFNYLLVFHNESKGLVYFESVNNIFDLQFIERIRFQIRKGYIQFRQIKGQIVHGMFEQYYLLLISSKYTQIILVLDNKPNDFADEALSAFATRFESRWENELQLIYSIYEGNIDLFFNESKNGQNIQALVNEIFHLNYHFPHHLGTPKTRLQGNYKKIWKIAQTLAKESGYIIMRELWFKSESITKIDKNLIADIIYEFLSRGYIKPIPFE